LQLGDLAPGVNIIVGDNEAGKTSTMEALRAGLFGLLGRQHKKRNVFDNPDGGDRWVQLNLGVADGSKWQLDRRDGELQVRDDDGKPIPGHRVSEALRNVDRELYESVFAFALTDMVSLSALGHQEVQDRLLGMAMGAGMVSPAQALARLNSRRDDLFRANGRVQVVAKECRQLEDLRASLRAENAVPKEYDELTTARQDAEKRLQEMVSERRHLQSAITRRRELLGVHEHFLKLKVVDQELAQFAHARCLTEAGQAKMQQCESTNSDLQRQLSDLAATLDEVESERALLALRDDLAPFALLLDKYPRDSGRLESLPRELLAASDDVSRVSASTDRAAAECEGFSTIVEIDKVDLSTVAVVRVRERVLGAHKHEATVASSLARLQEATESIKRLEQIEADDAVKAANERDTAAATRPAELGKLATKAAGASVVLGVFATALEYVGQSLAAALCLGVCLAAAGSWWLLRRLRFLEIRRATQRDEAATERARAKHEREMAAALRTQQERQRVVDDAEVASAKAVSEVAEWMAERQLSSELSINSLGDVIDALRDWQHQNSSLGDKRAEVERLDGDWQKLSATYTPLLKASGFDAKVDELAADVVASQIERAVGLVRQQAALRQRSDELGREVAQHKARIERLEQQRGGVDKTITALLTESGASSPGEYWRWAEDFKRFRELDDERRHLEAIIIAARGDDEPELSLRERLGAVDRDAIALQLVADNDRSALLEKEESELQRQLGSHLLRLEQIQNDTQLGALRQQQAGSRARLLEGGKEWLELATASWLIERARERFERDHQPEVLQLASRYFTDLTGGMYTGIRVHLDGHELFAERQDGTQLPLLHLSRGTVEPLYLALRLAVIADYLGSGSGAPPVVMDDVLVNFDDHRSRFAAAAIMDLAARGAQVLLMTCHQRTLDHFAEFDAAKVVRLGD